MKKWLILLAWLSGASLAHADLWINPGFYSYHFEQDKGFNNVNTGLGFEASLSDHYAFTAGFFENSDRHTSRYVGVYAMPWKFGNVKLGAAMGAFDGYPKMRDGGWFPAIVPAMAIEGHRLGLNIHVVPTVGDKLHGAIAFQVKYNLAP